MNFIKVLILLFFAFLFLPLKIHIKSNTDKIKITFKMLGVKLYSIEKLLKKGKNNLEDTVYNTTVKILDTQEKILGFKEIKKIYDNLDIEYINLNIGFKDPIFATYVFTAINIFIGSQMKKFEKSKIEMQMLYTEKIYDYKINCIISIRLAENIIEITKVIYKLLKERWNKVWQNILLKT